MKPINLNAPKYRRVINEALRRPWCVTADIKTVIFELLMYRAQGGRLTAEEIRARISDDDEEDSPRRVARTVRPTPNGGAIGIVPVYGVIAHRTFEASSGMTSTEMISAMLKRALTDSEISTILLDVSSPGGGVEGVPELAAEIFVARKTKPIVAIANNLAASAAYWLSSQADELLMIPSGQVGSIGVFSMHADYSAWLEKEGIKITAMSAGEKKLEGNPWEPLDSDAKAHFQSQVDEVYADFIKAVAKGRGVSQSKVKTDFGQGRVFTAEDALKRGLVDRVATFDETVVRLAGQKSRSRGAGAATGTDIAPGLMAMPDAVLQGSFDDTVARADPAPSEARNAADAAIDRDESDLVAARMRMALELDAER